MKFVPHAAAICLAATQATAGGLSDEIVEAPVMQEPAMAAPAGSSSWIIPALVFGALVAVAVSSGDDDDGSSAPAPVPGPAPAPVPGPGPAIPAPSPGGPGSNSF